jgi:hypothetical protein
MLLAFSGGVGGSWRHPFGVSGGGVPSRNRQPEQEECVDRHAVGLGSSFGAGPHDVDFGVAIIVVCRSITASAALDISKRESVH